MSDQTETLAAILAEMRDLADHRAADAGGERPGIELLRSYADRIEAAAEREREAYCDLCKEKDAAYDRLLLERDKAIKASAPGNASAIREALERIVGWCEGCHADACEKVCRPGLTSESIHAALAALSAPARNCDRPFRLVEEAIGAYVAERGDGPHLGYCDAIKWMLATAEGGAE